MQLTQEVHVEGQVKIQYKGPEDVRVSVVGMASYADGERTVTTRHDIEDDDLKAQVVALCEAILEAHGSPVARQALREASKAEDVALARGEF